MMSFFKKNKYTELLVLEKKKKSTLNAKDRGNGDILGVFMMFLKNAKIK